MRLALVNSVLGLSLTFAGCLLGSILVTLYLGAAASCLDTVLYWWQFRRAMHKSGTTPRRRTALQALHRSPSTLASREEPRRQPVTAVAVSRPVPAGSYVSETPQAARPGEEMS